MRSHLASLLDDFRKHGQATALVWHRGVRSYASTYQELAEVAGRFSAELVRRDIAAGERVVLWGENSAAWISAFFGCLLRGVLAVPLDAAGSPEFAQRIIAEVTPKLVVGDMERLRTLSLDIPMLQFAELEQHLPSTADFRVDPSVAEDSPFQIIFTSGTTSEPKGIVHTHRNLLASLRPIEAEIAKYRRYERWVHPLRFLHTLPLSHVFGQFMGLWIPALLGAELHFTDVLEPSRLVDHIRRERISVLIAVPRILNLIRSHLIVTFPTLRKELEDPSELSALRRWWQFRAVHRALGWKFWAVISGGASLADELELFWNRLGFALIQGYGLTETAALVTLNHPFRIGRGTIGRALPGREVRLSETGEILVRGDMVATRTWKGGRLHQREGEWLATGDLAEQSEAGEFRFMGRKGDVIVSSSGMNIFASDLEAAIRKQPGVQDCAVISCEFPSGPEAVCVVQFSGDDAALQQMLIRANTELSDYQQIRRILRWPELALPYTSTGKLLKRTIKAWACSTLPDRPSRISAADALLSMISSITGESLVAGADELRLSQDLHLDSLVRVQLASLIEQSTGVQISDSMMATLETLGHLRSLIDSAETNAPNGLMPNSHPLKGASSAYAAHSAKHLYPHWPWWAPVRWLRILFLELLLRPLVGMLLAPQVVRSKHELPRGSMLIVANHLTALDGALVLYALPRRLRHQLVIAMSGEMLVDFRFGRAAPKGFGLVTYWSLTALFNVFPLPRLHGFRQSFAHAGEAMDRGHSVLVFPEGTRSRNAEILPFQQGIGLLASQLGVAVLPIAFAGLDELRAKRARWLRSGHLQIRVGAPTPWSSSKSPTEWTIELEAAVRALAGRT